jgi:carbon monoxide dehydrogenase subunit G
MMNTWNTEHTLHINARPEAIWAKFRDVATWKTWNAGIESIELEGPFASGTWFTMKPPGQDAFRSRLVDVRENVGFTDETRIEDLVITVAHRLEPVDGGTRVVYAVQASGPGAAEIGPAIASDFPDVLAALARTIAPR